MKPPESRGKTLKWWGAPANAPGAGPFMTSRIHFDFNLIDKRHKAFVEGKREGLLSLYHIVSRRSLVPLILRLALAAAALAFGGKSLIYDWSVAWNTTRAVIGNISVHQYKNSFNYWYEYSFRTEDGSSATGQLVLDDPNSYAVGASIPVIYVASDPGDNRYAHESMPRSVRDWAFVAVGGFVLGLAGFWLRGDFAEHKHWREVVRNGQPIRGVVTGARWFTDPVFINAVRVEYSTKPPGGFAVAGVSELPAAHLAARDLLEAGTAVAIWYVPVGNRFFLL